MEFIETSLFTRIIYDYLSEVTSIDFGNFSAEELDSIDIDSDDGDIGPEITEKEADDAPIVRFVHKIILDSITQGASDIHFEPYEKTYRIRYRIDGMLYEVAGPPTRLANRIAARLKVMSQLDISERRIPQDPIG